MSKKGSDAEQIVSKLRQIEVLTAGGKALAQAYKGRGIEVKRMGEATAPRLSAVARQGRTNPTTTGFVDAQMSISRRFRLSTCMEASSTSLMMTYNSTPYIVESRA